MSIRKFRGIHRCALLWCLWISLVLPFSSSSHAGGAEPQRSGAQTGLRVHITGGTDEVTRFSLDQNQYLKIIAVSDNRGSSEVFRLQAGQDVVLPVGAYLVTASHPRFLPQTAEAIVKPGVVLELSMNLQVRPAVPETAAMPVKTMDAPAPYAGQAVVANESSGRLRISVWDEEQKIPINSAASLSAMAATPDGPKIYTLHPGRFDALPVGQYLVTASAPDFQAKDITVVVQAGRATLVDCGLLPKPGTR